MKRHGRWISLGAFLACLMLSRSALCGELSFSEVAVAAGIDFRTISGEQPSREILEVNGGGVALFDFDLDGDLDIFFANGATLDAPEKGPGSRLYENDGSGKFRNVTKAAGVELRRWAMGVSAGDYDGDGDDDLYVACFGANVLLRNDIKDGHRQFTDVTDDAGVGNSSWSSSSAFGDIDGDGDLDLYVTNYLEFTIASPPERSVFKGAPIFGGPMGLSAPHDVLYENLGNGRFRDATKKRGCEPKQAAYSLGVRIADFDQDGDQDIFVGNDSVENFLFRNRGDGTFDEYGVASGLAANYDGRPQATMGIALGDVDGNGYADLFSTNFSSDTNTLHLNLGKLLFDDRTSQFGLAAISRPFLSWGAGFFDFDLDGDEDLLIASGHIYPEAAEFEIDSSYRQPLLLFERRGSRFHRRVDAGEIFSRQLSGRTLAFGDLDGDGDVDAVLVSLNEPVRLLRNDTPSGRRLIVELEGPPGNPHALGSRIELIHGRKPQRRWILSGGYQASDAPLAYFGLESTGGPRVVLHVDWPDGSRTTHRKIPGDRRVLLKRDGSHEISKLREKP